MSTEYRHIQEARVILKNLSADKIMFKLEKHGEAYVIPIEMIDLMILDDLLQDKDVKMAESIPSTNADATIGVDTGEIWEALAIHSVLETDANVGNRNFQTRIVSSPPTGIILTKNIAWENTALVVPASKEAQQHIIPGRDDHTTNNDGTIAHVAGENPGKLFLDGGSSITAYTPAADKKAGDQLGLKILYKIVGSV